MMIRFFLCRHRSQTPFRTTNRSEHSRSPTENLASPNGIFKNQKTRKKLKKPGMSADMLGFFVCAESRILPKIILKTEMDFSHFNFVLALSGNKKALENSNSQRGHD
jgi:hypothetical protein